MRYEWKRTALQLFVAAGFVAAIVAILAFTNFYAVLSDGKMACATSILTSQWPKFLGCAMAAHENLAGGLIGGAGALFAAWLAYSSTQRQIKQAEIDAKHAARLRARERFLAEASKIDQLELAKGYLSHFQGEFPDENDVQVSDWAFVLKLLDLHERARVYLSESAAEAPDRYGVRIKTVMWRMEVLADRAKELGLTSIRGTKDGKRLNEEVREGIIGVRNIIRDLNAVLPRRKEQLANLHAQLVLIGSDE